MHLIQAKRQNIKIKIGLQAPSGAGKTMSALLVAFGITNDWSKIAIIDTENHSANLYSHLGSYNVLNVKAPFAPERYIEAIEVCLKAQMEVIIIDSLSHEWDYIVEQHGQLAGNSYTNWSKFTPRHQKFINTILQTDAHIICTIRTKQDYILQEKNGKQIPEKVGLKPIQRDGIDYEFTLVFDIDIKHNAIATKDRTGLFVDKPDFRLSSDAGQQIVKWCQQSMISSFSDKNGNTLTNQIQSCTTIDELRELYLTSTTDIQSQYKQEFNQKKYLLELINNHSLSKAYHNGANV
ncbi:MAG TPA: AAA family ATPase [Emticicia sp.]